MNFNEKKLLLENIRTEVKQYFNENKINLTELQINNLISNSFNNFIEDKKIKKESEIVISRWTYTGSGGLGGGKTYKPKNILLNWDKLIETGLGIIAGGIPLPDWTLYLTGLLFIKSVADIITVKIDEQTSMTLWAMHSKIGRNNYKKIDELLPIINNEIKLNNRSSLNLVELDNILVELKKLGCVKTNGNNEWCLVEQIYV